MRLLVTALVASFAMLTPAMAQFEDEFAINKRFWIKPESPLPDSKIFGAGPKCTYDPGIFLKRECRPPTCGKEATVCGIVTSTSYAAGSKGQPTYLKLDHKCSAQIFTILIWGSDRPKFGTPETAFRGKRVCVTGTIEKYSGEIVTTDPRQLTSQ
jgi:hypothetical protein